MPPLFLATFLMRRFSPCASKFRQSKSISWYSDLELRTSTNPPTTKDTSLPTQTNLYTIPVPKVPYLTVNSARIAVPHLGPNLNIYLRFRCFTDAAFKRFEYYNNINIISALY